MVSSRFLNILKFYLFSRINSENIDFSGQLYLSRSDLLVKKKLFSIISLAFFFS